MSKQKTGGSIRCLAHRTYLRKGSNKTSVQGIRVDIMGGQKVELSKLAERIGHANSATDADVLAVWKAMEVEIKRALEDGHRVALGGLGTLRLEVGAKAGKSTAHNITSKDIEVKGITFTPAKKFIASIKELTFECEGITRHPLSESRTKEALTEYFATHQYMSVRDYAILCHCSTSTARRRIAEMLEEGKLERSGIARGLYKLRIENCASE